MTRILYVPFLPVGGIALSPDLVLIRRSCRGDRALLVHELRHVEQQKHWGTLYFWRNYICSRKYRMAMEVSAYWAQWQNGAHLDACARRLCYSYWLGISYNQAFNAIKNHKGISWATLNANL